MKFRKQISFALAVWICLSVLTACTVRQTETETPTETASDNAPDTENGTDALPVCESIAERMKTVLDRDAAIACLVENVDFSSADAAEAVSAVMQTRAYTDEIDKLKETEMLYVAENLLVYAFSREGVICVYDSHLGEPEDWFTKHSLRYETWEDSDFSGDDRELFLAGKPFAYSNLAGNGKVRSTVMTQWFREGDTVFYVAATVLTPQN